METQIETLTFEERFKQAFPLYNLHAPKQDKLLKFVADEREQAGAEGIILGSKYERATLFEIASKTDAEGSPAEFKQQILDYLAKDEPQPNGDGNETA